MKDNESHSRARSLLTSRWTLMLFALVLVLGLLAIYPGWRWLSERGSPAEPPRPPELLAGDRQRLETFLAAHDYEAFLRLMELQPRKVRDELPAEWLRRYEEIKPALLFTVREAATEDIINSANKYETPLLSLRWSEDGTYLVDVLGEKRKVFDGRTGRLVSVGHEPALLPENDSHWLFGKAGGVPKSYQRPLDDLTVARLCVTFGHDPQYWQAKAKQVWSPFLSHVVVLLMPSKDETRILTNYAISAFADGGMNAIARRDPARQAGNPVARWVDTGEGRRCYNVWKADALQQ